MKSTPCPKCGSEKTNSRGNDIYCRDCRRYTAKDQSRESAEIEYGRNFVHVICASRRILTEREIIKQFNIDTNVWELDSFTIKTSEGYRKDRKSSWKIGKKGVAPGSFVEDSGKMLVVPLFHVRANFVKKVAEIVDRSAIESFIASARKFSPKYPKIHYKKQKDGLLLELGLPDMQLGRMVLASEAGQDLSPELAIAQADHAVDCLLGYCKGFPISRILFPVGNDLFDANTAAGTTAHGTPQRDDPRWQRTFGIGCQFAVRTVDKLATIAPVDVLVVPGNHDEERAFYLGEYISAWYRRCPNVTVDNQPKKRKYYRFARNLIGLTHGYYEKTDKLAALMPQEEPRLWAATTYREWHLGDKHHKVDMVYKTEEMENGVVVRILRSIASPSVWEFDKGLVGALKAGEVFLWHPDKGLVAQFTGRVE